MSVDVLKIFLFSFQHYSTILDVGFCLAEMAQRFHLHKVPTPSGIFDSSKSPTLFQLGKRLTDELSEHKAWNETCTQILRESLPSLCLYDQMEWSMMRAYGSDNKILFYPLMIMCYHPTCLARKKPAIKLKRLFKIDEFSNHLKDHSGAIGTAMQRRFNAVALKHLIHLIH